MELIATTTVGSGGAASIDFTSIPSTYTDLMVYYSLRSSHSSETAGLAIRFNGDSTTSNYLWRSLYGTGSSGAASATSSFNRIGSMVGSTATSNVFSNGAIHIPNYTGSSNKVASDDDVTENNSSAAVQFLVSLRWNNTAAISSITLVGYSGDTIQQHSTAYLYGILKGSGGASVS